MKRSTAVTMFSISAAAMFGLCLTACEKGPAEKAGAKVDKAVQKTGDAVKDAGEKIKDAGK